MDKPNYTGKTYTDINNNEYGYVVADDGYDIYINYRKAYVQHEPYIPNAKLTYEENAINQIKGMIDTASKVKEAKEAETKQQSQLDGIEQAVSTILANQMGA